MRVSTAPPLVFPGLSGGKYVPLVAANAATGNTTLYTVPAGKQAFVGITSQAYNASAGNITFYLELLVSGTYYRLTASSTPSTGTAAAPNMIAPIVLAAGEAIAINCTTNAGLNFRGGVYEWDATDTRLRTGRSLALASGGNTILTVGSGKTFSACTNLVPMGNGALNLAVSNSTGGSLNYYANMVPSGGSAGSTNQLHPATAVADGAVTGFSVGTTLTSGDFISVNSSGADAGSHQIAWVTGYEI